MCGGALHGALVLTLVWEALRRDHSAGISRFGVCDPIRIFLSRLMHLIVFLTLGIVWKENLPSLTYKELPAGVPAAFQALFGEGIEKTDTGLEAAFAKVDEDMKDRGKIDTDDMKAFISNLYDRPRELKRTEALWARMAREHAEKESNEHLQRRRASTTLLADVHAIEPALPKEFSWRAFETPNGDKIDLLTMQRNQHIPSMCRGQLSDPLPLLVYSRSLAR